MGQVIRNVSTLLVISMMVLACHNIKNQGKENSQVQKTPTVHSEITTRVECTALSPDLKTFARAYSDGTVILWDVQTGEKKHSLAGPNVPVLITAFSPDSNTLVSGQMLGVLILWDVHTGFKKQVLHSPSVAVSAVAFSPDGKTLASGMDDELILWDVYTGQMRRVIKGIEGIVSSLVFSPSGRLVAFQSYAGPFTEKLSKVVVWDAEGNKMKFVSSLRGATSPASIAFSPNGEMLASAWGNNSLILLNAETGEPMQALSMDGHLVVFSRDSKMLASVGSSNKVRLYDTQSGVVKRVVVEEGNKNIFSVAFSRDNNTIVIASGNMVELLDVKTGKVKETFMIERQ